MTNNNYHRLIEVLVGVTATTTEENKKYFTCRPIFIGDVLEKMSKEAVSWPAFEKMVGLWEPLGFTKSLQEIVRESEERTDLVDDNGQVIETKMTLNPQANNLINFLTSIFL